MRVCWLLGLAACGRIGFDVPPGDGAAGDDAPLDAAACTGAATQLPIDTGAMPEGSWVSQFRASPMEDQGFGVSYVAPDGVAFALTFSTTSGVAPIKTDTQIVASAGSIQPLGMFDGLILATTAGSATLLRPFSPALVATGNGTGRTGRTPALRALAAQGSNLAYIDYDDTTGRLDGRPLAATGADGTAPHTIDGVGEQAQEASIAATPWGFAVTWLNTTGTPAATGSPAPHVVAQPRRVRGVILDPGVHAGVPVDIGPAGIDQTSPSVAGAADMYLFAWSQVAGTDMQVWMQFADLTMALVGPPVLVGHGGAPKVATDGTSFWIVWSNATSTLSGVHVTTDHAVRAFDVPASGGTAVDFDLVELVHIGAPGGPVALLWFERGGSGHPLWFVPACTL